MEVALATLSAAAVVVLDFPLRFESVAACEPNGSCQRVLAHRLQGGHIFEDINHRVFVASTGKNFLGLVREVFSAVVARGGYCITHRTCCEAPSVDVDASGSLCTPWSS